MLMRLLADGILDRGDALGGGVMGEDAMNTITGAPGGKASSAPLLGRDAEPTLFELSHRGRRAWSFRTSGIPEVPVEDLVPVAHRRSAPVDASGNFSIQIPTDPKPRDIRRCSNSIR